MRPWFTIKAKMVSALSFVYSSLAHCAQRPKPLMALCAKQHEDSRHMHTGYLSFEDISGIPK